MTSKETIKRKSCFNNDAHFNIIEYVFAGMVIGNTVEIQSIDMTDGTNR